MFMGSMLTESGLWWLCDMTSLSYVSSSSVLLPGGSRGWRSLMGCSPWGREESDTTERLHFHVSLSCVGEGNGNPLQCSCLENPRDGGAWWAAIYGVTPSRTQLKRLSSSSSSRVVYKEYSLVRVGGPKGASRHFVANIHPLLLI